MGEEKLKKIAVLALSSLLLLTNYLLIVPVGSDVIVPFEWLVPGAYAHYHGNGGTLFYPNHTEVDWYDDDHHVFLEWTVVNRTGDVVRLNLTYFAEGNAWLFYEHKSMPDGKVNILDVVTAALAFGTEVYEWEFNPNADVTGPGGEPDLKINILDIVFITLAFGSTPDDPDWNSKADIAPDEWKWGGGHVRHHKNLFLEIDVFSRETYLDGKPLGKTCFWADPYADIGDEVLLYTMTPGEIVGNVTDFKDMTYKGWPGVTRYKVRALQIDPYVNFRPSFDWDTGLAYHIYLQGAQPVNPDSPHEYWTSGPNSTRYLIYRYASIPLGTELNIGIGIEQILWLESTNIQIGSPE